MPVALKVQTLVYLTLEGVGLDTCGMGFTLDRQLGLNTSFSCTKAYLCHMLRM